MEQCCSLSKQCRNNVISSLEPSVGASGHQSTFGFNGTFVTDKIQWLLYLIVRSSTYSSVPSKVSRVITYPPCPKNDFKKRSLIHVILPRRIKTNWIWKSSAFDCSRWEIEDSFYFFPSHCPSRAFFCPLFPASLVPRKTPWERDCFPASLRQRQQWGSWEEKNFGLVISTLAYTCSRNLPLKKVKFRDGGVRVQLHVGFIYIPIQQELGTLSWCSTVPKVHQVTLHSCNSSKDHWDRSDSKRTYKLPPLHLRNPRPCKNKGTNVRVC